MLEGAQTELGKALGREQRREERGAGDSKPTRSRGVRRGGQAAGSDTLWPHQHQMWASDKPPSERTDSDGPTFPRGPGSRPPSTLKPAQPLCDG